MSGNFCKIRCKKLPHCSTQARSRKEEVCRRRYALPHAGALHWNNRKFGNGTMSKHAEVLRHGIKQSHAWRLGCTYNTLAIPELVRPSGHSWGDTSA